jgi:hypothetical protein
MTYYCTRETGRKDSNGNKEQSGGEVDQTTGECTVCGAKN